MEIGGLGNNYFAYNNVLTNSSSASDIAADEVKSELNALSEESSDEQLMEACKSFEAYLVEQVMDSMKATVTSINNEEENDYMAMFGDTLYEEYANQIAQTETLGISKMLFDSIKRNM